MITKVWTGAVALCCAAVVAAATGLGLVLLSVALGLLDTVSSLD